MLNREDAVLEYSRPKHWCSDWESSDMNENDFDQLAINTIRTLSTDAVQQAKSGHPGTPVALAPLIYTIWNWVMRFDPKDPIWPQPHYQATAAHLAAVA